MQSCYDGSCVIAFLMAFCLISLHLAVAGYERSCTMDDYLYSRNMGVCGSRLSRLLSHICGIKGYNKRSTGMNPTSISDRAVETSFKKPRLFRLLKKTKKPKMLGFLVFFYFQVRICAFSCQTL